MNLNNFHLLKEDNGSYQIGHPNGRAIIVSKKGLSDKAHSVIKKLEKAKFEDGGSTGVAQPEPVMTPADVPAGSESQMQPAQLAETAPAAPLDPIAQQAQEKESALETARGSLEKGTEAEAAEGEANAKAYGNYGDKLNDMPTAFKINQDMQKKDQALQQAYMDAKLDPNRFWHDKATGSKVLAGIGLLFSGMGSATTGQPNYALETINNAINRDIDAQKNDQSKAMNLWKMNREATHDSIQATLLTQNQLLNATKAQILKNSAVAQGPIAKARAADGILKLDQQIASNRFLYSQMAGSPLQKPGQLNTTDPATLVTSMVEEKQQPKVFDEIEAAQNTAKNAPAILKAFDDAANTRHAADVIPGVLNADQKALHSLLGPTFKDVEGTVRQAAMDNLFSNITPQDFDNARTKQIKRNALVGYMKSKSAAPVAKGHGIDLTRFKSTNMDFPGQTVERITPSGRMGLFDANTKAFLGYK